MTPFKDLCLAAALLLTPSFAGAQQALLWVPAGEAGAEEILSLLENGKDLRLTAAFPALPKTLAERIKKLEKDGRLELALRPAGDPPLPLLYYPAAPEVRWAGKPSTSALYTDQYFLMLRLAQARDAAVRALKKSPAGLVSPPGGLASDYFPIAKALGVRWIACGPLASTAAAVLENGGVYAVPFVNFSTAPQAGPAFTLFDETAAADPAALRALLAEELKASVPQRRLTVSEAIALAVSTPAAAADISAAAAPWSGDYSPWASSPAQAGALAALAQTREALMLHLNSAQGNYLQAAPAFDEYFTAEDGRKLLELASADQETASETEIELRSALANAFRLMQKPAPPWAFSSLADAISAPQQADKLQVSRLPGGFSLKNLSRPATPPAKTLRLPDSADPAKIWKLDGLKVVSSPEGVLFQFAPGALDNALREPSGFSHIRLDLYIDVNHRPRAGMTRPLEGRPYRIYPESAWEYALEVTPDGAKLYKTTPRGPAPAGSYPAKAEDGWISVQVPASALKGSPALWGYAALLLAPKAGGGYAVTDYIAEEIAGGYIYAVQPARK
ncbi:MAG: glucodextranase DOMON-like domain-containing protein [Elusimicrobiales bacterium]|nr:glucodextranase DOMON-like domain-containing protein [Elusimicrobiales bacterium]